MLTELEDRFWSKVDRRADDECWPWMGALATDGYGQISFHQKQFLVHRIAWEIANGPIPEGLCICHHCDNPSCCNVRHLFEGTHSDNMADMVAKGRSYKGPRNFYPGCSGHSLGRGDGSGSVKLTPEQVAHIRSHPELSGASMAAMYGVSDTTVLRARRGETWTPDAMERRYGQR